MKAFILNISFNDLQPTVWRRVVMPAGATFKRLHDTIMETTNFTGSHLYKFESNELIVSNDTELSKASKRKSYTGKPVKSPSSVKVDEYLEQEKRINFTYDFGDCWEMTIELESIVEDYYFGYPTILAGEGSAPPEDVGGVEGFKTFLADYNDNTSTEYLAMHEWAESQLYRELNIDFVNDMLKHVKYQKTEWDQIDHDNYVILSDKYRGSDLYVVEDIVEPTELFEYVVACGHLYGQMTMDAFLKLYNDQHEEKVTANNVFSLNVGSKYAKELKEAKVNVYVNEIIHQDIDGEIYNTQFLPMTFGKPYYTPSREELLNYVDSRYYEKTPSIKALTKRLETDMGGHSFMTEQLIYQLVVHLKREYKFGEAVKQFVTSVNLQSEQQLNVYIALITEVANTTRLWINRGFTPEELSRRELKTTASIPVKVGRNDACICGSGKKYKKCCGK